MEGSNTTLKQSLYKEKNKVFDCGHRNMPTVPTLPIKCCIRQYTSFVFQ